MMGKFVVFEGIDGSGTSTQATLLYQYLQKKGIRSTLTAQPSHGIIGNLIRQTLKQRVIFTHNPAQFDRQMAYLFVADRHDHLYNEFDGVMQFLEKNTWVICTRYTFSSIAYNAHTPGDFHFIEQLNSAFPNPDLLIYLDTPWETSLQRLQERQELEVYETQEKLQQVRSNFYQILSSYSGLHLQLDSRESIDSLHDSIVQSIEHHFF